MPNLKTDRANLFWLEDRQSTARAELDFAQRIGAAVYLSPTPDQLQVEAEERLGNSLTPEALRDFRVGFVIDIMIPGLLSLAALNRPDLTTNGGRNAGYIFVDQILRAKDSPFRECPVCLLSERQLDSQLKSDIAYTNQRGGPAILFVRKFSPDFSEFQAFIRSL
jgi:hypothetical protein